MDLEFYKQKALDQHKQHQSTLKKLKKKPPKNLDFIMEDLHEEVFE